MCSKSKNVHFLKFVPDSYSTLDCDFIGQRNGRDKIFHKTCLIESERVPVM